MKEKLKAYAAANYVPIIRDETAGFLREFCKQHQPKTILEIGTAIGYSGLIMLEVCEALLTTIEVDEARMEIAKKTLQNKKVTFILKDALVAIKELEEKCELFDLIFLDGPKGQYVKYLPHLLKLMKKDGAMLCDNISFGGQVFNEEYPKHKHRSHILNMRKFVEEIQNDKRLNVKIYDVADSMAVVSWK